ncbi:hypothetical protein DFH11DRAFT_1726686 [Phellopilus nigrolimitatus]|nr:hypothetical protein DFH11DRAFT_1726686 [Phellopilus nigrolimitatus]
MSAQPNAKPAWMTDDLADEWIEADEEQEQEQEQEQKYNDAEPSPDQPLGRPVHSTLNLQGARKFGTENFGTTKFGTTDFGMTNFGGFPAGEEPVQPYEQAGTFVVREDLPVANLPQTPARAKGAMKNIFSPLALERMFEPPSPPGKLTPKPKPSLVAQRRISNRPVKPSKLSQVIGASFLQEEEGEGRQVENGDEIVETDMLNMGSFGNLKPASDCNFTFSVPHPMKPSFPPNHGLAASPNSNGFNKPNPQAQSTPIPSSQSQQQPNPNDSRGLRLFQFHYDTYTRDHLSALVDSFGVNSPSNGSTSKNTTSVVLPASPDAPQEADESFSRLRAAKRIKLTPAAELLEETRYILPQPPLAAPTERPVYKKDYVGESRSLMQQIKRARDISMVSVASNGQQDLVTQAASSNVANNLLQIPNARHTRIAPSASSSTTNELASKFSSLAYRRQAADLMAKIKGDQRLLSEKTDRSFSSQKSEEDVVSVQERSCAPSPETRPRSPLKRRIEVKENDSEPDPSPPSYAASIARSAFAVSPKKGRRRQIASNNFNVKDHHIFPAHGNERNIFVMPVVFSNEHSPVDRVRSPNPTFLAPPATAFNGMRFNGQARTQSTDDDLNRFVSSGSTATTATTGTTLTAGSAGSGVKHAGPPQMVRIGPTDVPALPDRVGGMVFDHTVRRWVKEREPSDRSRVIAQPGPVAPATPGEVEGSGESEDPFRDIESLRDEDSSRPVSALEVAGYMASEHERELDRSDGTEDMHVVDSSSDSEFDDAEDAHLSTFTFDNPGVGVVHVMTGEANDGTDQDDEITDSDADSDDAEVQDASAGIDEDEDFSNDFASMSLRERQHRPRPIADASMANNIAAAGPWRNVGFGGFGARTLITTPCPAEKRHVQPPRSALKSTSVTPINRGGHGRSVSFSDGRKDGKIMGLDIESDDTEATLPSGILPSAPSLRSKRIADMLGELEEQSFEEESSSTSKGTQHAGWSHERNSQSLSQNSMDMGSSDINISPRRTLQRSPTIRSPGHSNTRRMTMPGNISSRVNATFLTECSFGVAHDRLVQVITDVQPYEPYWDSLNSVDLSGRKLDSVARLKEFLPKLDSLNLNNNILSWLSGVPGTVRTLSVASNMLTSLTSFGHLLNLENLDISYNDIDSLQQLSCLRHLRELRADGNKITNLDGLVHFDGLLKLSLQNNGLRDLDFSIFRWTRLELLNLSGNRLELVQGLGALPSLVSINLDNNALSALDEPRDASNKARATDLVVLHKLRILRLSGNRLRHLDVVRFPNLRTLYVDNNCLAEGLQRGQKKARHRLLNMHRLNRLENFSARNQGGAGSRDSGLHLEGGDVRDVKRLYLSGNPSPLPLGPTAQACYNLVYLELAACRLTSLSPNFSALVPNVRALNLNYNFLETDEIARGLAGLTRLRKLTIVGGRMTGTKALIKMLSAMGQNIEMLDFRMNPCTLAWYLPLLVQDKDDRALLQPSDPPKEQHQTPFPSSLPSIQSSGLNGRGGNALIAEPDQEAGARGIGAAPSSTAEGTGKAHELNSRAASASNITSLAKGKEKQSPSHWEALDAQFRRGLPDKAYAGRLAYRGLVVRACPQIKVLDGVRITEKERRKAEALLKRVLKEAEAANETIRASDQR